MLDISDYFALGELIATELREVLPTYTVNTVYNSEDIEQAFKNQQTIVVSHYLDRVLDSGSQTSNPVTSVAQQWLVLISIKSGMQQNSLRGVDYASKAGETIGKIFDAVQDKQLNQAFTPLRRVNSDFRTSYLNNSIVIPLQFEAVMQYSPR